MASFRLADNHTNIANVIFSNRKQKNIFVTFDGLKVQHLRCNQIITSKNITPHYFDYQIKNETINFRDNTIKQIIMKVITDV